LTSLTSGIDYGVHNADAATLARGVLERVFFRKVEGEFCRDPGPVPGVFDQLAYFREAIKNDVKHITPILREKFPELYQGRKRTVYQNAVESLRLRPVARKDSYIQAFVKAEKLNLDAKPDPVPRVIQPRNPRYNVEVGRYLKVAEKRVYKAVNRLYGRQVVAKGLNALQRANLLRSQWCQFSDPVAVGLDASRFDQSVSQDALKWEHSVYNSLFASRELAKLLRWQLVNRGFGRCKDGFVKYTVPGSRMSGDMNTALGNVLLMCAMFHLYFKQTELKAGFVNDGDDCVVIVERTDLPKFEGVVAWFRRFGFVMKREQDVDVFEQIDFCQSRPVNRGDKWVMMRHPWITMSKDAFWLRPVVNKKTWERQCQAISICGQKLTSGLPVKYAWYSRLSASVAVTGNIDYSESGMERLATGMNGDSRPILPVTRASFFRAFGITPDRQIAIEDVLVADVPIWQEPRATPVRPGAPFLQPGW
jgi:hypothetical protein